MPKSFRLKSLKIAGFRGFTKEQSLEHFDTPCALLLGDNRSGKSSVLNAIEWCLFGDEIAKKNIGKIEIPERKGWEVSNFKSLETKVEAIFQRNNEILTVYREKKGKQSRFYFRTPQGESSEEGELRKLMGVEPSDFLSSIYLHQEVIRALLVEEPSSRREALDRLLGLTDLRNLLDGVEKAKIKKEMKEIDKGIDEIQTIIEAVGESKKGDMENSKEEGRQKGFSNEDFNTEHAFDSCRKIEKSIQDFANSYNVAAPKLPEYETLDEQGTFVDQAKDGVQILRTQRPNLLKKQELLQLHSQLKELIDAYRTLKDGIATIKKEKGDTKKIKGRLHQIEQDIGKLRSQRRSISTRAGVVDEALKYFELTEIKGETPCPVCEQTMVVKKVQQKLEEWRKGLEESLRPIEGNIKQFEIEERDLQDNLTKIKNLENRLDEKKNEIDHKRPTVEKILETSIPDQYDPLSILTNTLDKITEQINEINTAIGKGEEILKGIESDIKNFELIHKVLRLEQDIKNLEKVKESEEFKDMVKKKKVVEKFNAIVNEIKQAIEDTLRDSARERIDATKEAISRIYSQLVERTDYSTLGIDPKKFEIIAINNEGGVKPVLGFFNQGDMNCAALSIFLALAVFERTTHEIGFIILDDPSQSFDLLHKKRLINVFNQIPENKQLIVATMDGELKELLSKGITREKNIYRMGKWSPETGPHITLE